MNATSMKVLLAVGRLALLIALASSYARAATILDISSLLVVGDPTQQGRLSRNAIAQDWAGSELFPGILNPTITYHYHVYSVNVGITPFIQISVDSISPNTFVAAYDTSYVPNAAAPPSLGLNVNWLGDAGLSGNPFPGDPGFFQIRIPVGHNLLIVVSNVGASNVGVGDPYRILAEGFVDSEFTEPASPAVPEPSSAILLTAGGLAICVLRRFRQ